jgi:signal transduction histidine kinase/CheY-like chemotaxis protein
MWILLRSMLSVEPDFALNLVDLLESTQRNFIYTVMGLSLAWLFWISIGQPGVYVLVSLPYMLLIILICGAALLLVQRRQTLLAQIFLNIGLMAVVALGVFIFREPQLLFCLIFLPMIAAVTIGWWFGVAVELGVVAVVLGVTQYPLFANTPISFDVITIMGGVASGLLGFSAAYAMLTLSHWGLASFHQARANVVDIRHQREELFQVQDDLLQTNRELARLSNRLKVMTHVAEEARRVKEEFVANVSHELRTPLNMVIGFCEVISDSPRVYGNLSPALLADIAAIQRNGQHLVSLVNDVLDLSQIEAGRMALMKDWTTVQDILNAAIIAVKPLFESKGLYLEQDIPAEPVQLFCDGTRVREVLLNLLSNAGRFTEHGGVRIQARATGNLLTIAVIDTGPGISSENVGKLFEPFQQLDNSIRRREGTGLGLSISKQFVEMHGGKMWVESEFGVGTSFLFTLPLEIALSPQMGAGSVQRWVNPYFTFEKEIRRSKISAPQLVSRYVLLERGHTLKRLFERYYAEAEIVHVHDVETAIEQTGRSPSQALIINMLANPDPNLTAHIKELPYGTPIIECWVPGDDEPSQRLGVRRYLTKPVKRDELLEAIAQVGEGVQTILLVDDQPEVLQLFGRMLASSERAYTVIRAKNGQHALDVLHRRKPDLMLLDLVMPEVDGFEVLRLKNEDPEIRAIPVIIISANDPSGTPIISNQMNIHRKEGFSAREFLACIQAVSEVFSPKAAPDDRALPADSPA